MEREKIVNEIREKLDGISGNFEPTKPTYVLYSTNKSCRVIRVYLDEDHCVWFTLESKELGRFGAAHGWIATESLLKISKMLPAKWAVVRFHTPYGGCDLDWFVSREAIPADGDELGALYAYLIDYYSALVWTEVDDEFRAYPEEEEDCGAYFIATVED
jgi:hypothetical protein